MSKWTVAVAGSSKYSQQCAESLLHSPNCEVVWILSPQPRLLGRQQLLTSNPLHAWATDQKIATTLIDKGIDAVQDQIFHQPAVDFLLVVDFGYLIPSWLLKLPKIAPLNVHPSALPRWRGSSPGQFVLLYGESQSAVSLMVMNDGLDTGPLIQQLPFAVAPNWTQTEYYDYAFKLISPQLAQCIDQFAKGTLVAQPQSLISLTPIARRLSREDGFIEWTFLQELLGAVTGENALGTTSTLFKEVFAKVSSWPQTISQAVRGFAPWPGVWTIIPTVKGQKRMHLLSVQTKNQHLELEHVKIEGQSAALWSQVKNSLL